MRATNVKKFLNLDSFNKRADGTEMSHEEIYTAVVEAVGLDIVRLYLPTTDAEFLKEKMEEDKHLNNISIFEWERKDFAQELHRIGITSVSLSDIVCTLKQAARMIAEAKYVIQSDEGYWNEQFGWVALIENATQYDSQAEMAYAYTVSEIAERKRAVVI